MRNNRRKYDENSLFNKSEFSASDNEIRNKNRKFGNTIKPDRPMKKKLLILLGVLTTRCIAAGQPTGCEPYEVLQRRADSLFLSGNYQSSSEIFERILSTKQRQNKDFYNGACAAALVGDTATAFERLNRLLSENKRWYSVRMQDDPYLVSLHRDERWKTLIERRLKRISTNHYERSCWKFSTKTNGSEENLSKPAIRYIPIPKKRIVSPGRCESLIA